MSNKLIVTIKPTKHNVSTLKNRGLFSDDSSELFKCYSLLLQNKPYSIDLDYGTWVEYLLEDFNTIGLKF